MHKRTLTASQRATIESLPDHADAEIPTAEARMPASVYTDPARFALEQSEIFRRMPMPVTLSAMLPKPNMVYAHDDFGVPIVLTRDQQGQVHAFLNACGHRGARILPKGEPAAGGRLNCPFHAWSYSLQGQLVGLPRAEVFPTLDRSERGLRALPVREMGGIIWVGLDPDAEVDFSVAGGQLADDMDAFGLGDMHVYKRKTYDLAANWKILIETFLETYHVPPLHKNTIAQQFAPVPTLLVPLGPHTRQTIGRSNFNRNDLDLDVNELHKTVTHAYQIFPTAVLVTSPYHINFFTMMPRAANRTLVECYMVTKGPPDSDKARELYERTFEFNMTSVFGQEDFKAAELVQEGLASGALKEVCFGGLEQALVTLHATINRYVAKD